MGKLLPGGGNWLEYLEYYSSECQYFGGILPSTRNTSVFHALDTLSSAGISDGLGNDTAGTACARGSALLILPVFAAFRPPVPEYSQESEHKRYSMLRASGSIRVLLILLAVHHGLETNA